MDIQQWLDELDVQIAIFKQQRGDWDSSELKVVRTPIEVDIISSVEESFQLELPYSMKEFYHHCFYINLISINDIRIFPLSLIMQKQIVMRELYPDIPPNHSEKVAPFGACGFNPLFIRGADSLMPNQVLYLTEDTIFHPENTKEKMLVIESFEVFLERLLLDVKAAIRLDATWDYLWTPFFLVE